MAADVAAAILQELPTSTVWLAVYRDYNHEEGVCVRKANNGFLFKHFGGDRHNVNVYLRDAAECFSPAPTAATLLWSLINTLHKPRGLELVYVPHSESLKMVSSAPALFRIASAEISSMDAFIEQVGPLLDTLETVRMA